MMEVVRGQEWKKPLPEAGDLPPKILRNNHREGDHGFKSYAPIAVCRAVHWPTTQPATA